MFHNWRSNIQFLYFIYFFSATSLHTSKALFALHKTLHIELRKAFKVSLHPHKVVKSTDDSDYKQTGLCVFFILCLVVSCLIFFLFFPQSLFSPTCFSYASQYISRYEAQGEGTHM